MKNVVVTGGTSFLGVPLINLLFHKGYHVFSVIRPNSKNLNRLPKNKNLDIIELELENFELISKYIDTECQIFYHLAWDGVRVPQRDDATLQHKNYFATIHAINAANKLGCKKFIGTGSQAEYGVINRAVDESYKTVPITEYGKSKLKAYIDGMKLCNNYDIQLIWTRIFSLYGIHDFDGSFVMFCLEKMLKNERIPLTECTQMWDYLYLDDAVEALVALAENNCECGVYNLASGNAMVLKEYVLRMKDITRSSSILKFGEITYSSGGVVSFEPVVDKLKNSINWHPKADFEYGIKRIIEFLKREGYSDEKSKHFNSNI